MQVMGRRRACPTFAHLLRLLIHQVPPSLNDQSTTDWLSVLPLDPDDTDMSRRAMETSL